MSICEAELIMHAACGDQEAFRHLWEVHHAVAMAAALRLCHQRALAEEITQGAFLLAWCGLPRFQKGRPFRPWLMRGSCAGSLIQRTKELTHSSAFCPAEVYRVLRPGGLLLTAQGAPSISPTLADVLEGPILTWAQEEQGWDIDATLDEAGFETVEKLDAFPKTTFLDIGAVVYFLKVVPWTITDFDVERYRERLYQLHLRIKRHSGFTVRDHHRLLEMRKPAEG